MIYKRFDMDSTEDRQAYSAEVEHELRERCGYTAAEAAAAVARDAEAGKRSHVTQGRWSHADHCIPAWAIDRAGRAQ